MYQYPDSEQWAERLQPLLRELEAKRAIKRVVRRTCGGRRRSTPVAPETIPIHVRDEDQHVHYPASPADLVAVMHRLPPGLIDGIHSVTLCLGKEYQAAAIEPAEIDDYPQDPPTGRRSYEVLPGVYSPRVLGRYLDQKAGDKIELFAYVYVPDLPDREMWELVLRLWMLATFVHELAHFHHYSSNRRRRRWPGLQQERSETVAERLEARWVQRCVIPYLDEAYPGAVKKLDAWVKRHGGISIPLWLLAGTWRTDGKGYVLHLGRGYPNTPEGPVQLVFFGHAKDALVELAKAIAQSETPQTARLRFAQQLHYHDLNDETLCAIQSILEEWPDDLDALTLKADTYEDLKEYESAEALARDIVAADNQRVGAWVILARVCGTRGVWDQSLAAAQHGLAVAVDQRDRRHLLRSSARAKLELGRYAELEDDLTTMAEIGMRPPVWVTLRAIMLLRCRHYEEALRLAIDSLNQERPWDRALFLAVRFEAAHRLRRPEDAGELSAADLERLRFMHYGEWADQLAAEYGIGAT